MKGQLLSISIFFSLAFVWIYLINMALVSMVCRYGQTKRILKFYFLAHAILAIAGMYFAGRAVEIMWQISSITRGEGFVIGMSLFVVNIALPVALTAISVKWFSPGKWDKFLQIRISLFDKSGDQDDDAKNDGNQ